MKSVKIVIKLTIALILAVIMSIFVACTRVEADTEINPPMLEITKNDYDKVAVGKFDLSDKYTITYEGDTADYEVFFTVKDELDKSVKVTSGKFDVDYDKTYYATIEVIYNNQSIKKMITIKSVKQVAAQTVVVEWKLSSTSSEVLKSDLVEVGSILTPPLEPTKEGYIFKYWSKNGVEYDFADTVQISTTLVAEWTIIKYNGTFNPNNGEPASIIETDIESDYKLIAPIDIVKTGYKLEGWYKDEALSEKFDFDTSITSDGINLYAKWDMIDYDIEFYSSKTATEPLDVLISNEGNDYFIIGTIPSAPQKEYYQFNYWAYVENDKKADFLNDTFTENKAVYAVYKAKLITMTFVTNKAAQINSIVTSIDNDFQIYEPNSPEANGFIFSNWYYLDNDGNKINYDFTDLNNLILKKDIVLYAQWTPIYHYVDFDTGTSSRIAQQILYLETGHNLIIEPSIEEIGEKTGYEFDFWHLENEEEPFDFARMLITTPNFSQNFKLCASWKLHTYDITFDTVGGSTVDTKSVSYLDNYICPKPSSPSKIGYSFMYWYLSDSNVEYNFSTVIDSDITLHAKWNLNTYNVIFEDQYGSSFGSDPVNLTGNYEDGIANFPNDPVRDGYKFEGWYSASNEKIIATTPIYKNLAVYAKWSLKKYAVTFKYSTTRTEQVYGSIEGIILPENPTATYGTYFVYWMVENGERINAFLNANATQITSEMSVVPCFELNSYSIKFYKNVGDTTALLTNEVKHGNVYTGSTPSTEGFTKEGYTLYDTDRWAIVDSSNNLVPIDDLNTYVITENTNFYVYWKLIEYKFTIYINNENTLTEEYKTSILTSYKVDRQALDEYANSLVEGMTVVNWYSNLAKTELFDFETVVVEDNAITLYSSWIAARYNINFYNGTEKLNTNNIEIVYDNFVSDSDFEYLANPDTYSMQGYINRSKWAFYIDGTKVEKSVGDIRNLAIRQDYDFYVSYDLIVHTIKFDSKGGSTVADVKTDITKENKISAPVSFKNGYTLTCWSKNIGSTAIVFDNPIVETNSTTATTITLVANWNIITHTVHFDSDGGSVVSDKTTNITALNKITAPIEPTKLGYRFVEWRLDGVAFDFDNSVTLDANVEAEITLTAVWELGEYDVRLVYTDGDDNTVVYATTTGTVNGLELPSIPPEKYGYEFDGWYNEDVELTSSTAIKSNITATAKWQMINYEVRFNITNNDDPIILTTNIEKGFFVDELPAKRDGYVLQGWYYIDNTPFDFFTPVTGDCSVYSIWRQYAHNPSPQYVNASEQYVYSDIIEEYYNNTGNKFTYRNIIGLTSEGANQYDLFVPEYMYYGDDYTMSCRVYNLMANAFLIDGEVNTNLKTVSINHYLEIEAGAFKDCVALEEIYIGYTDRVIAFNQSALYNCTSLTSIVVPENLLYQYLVDPDWREYADFIVSDAAPRNKRLTLDGVQYLVRKNDCLVIGCDNSVDSIVIRDKVQNKPVIEILNSAFANCDFSQLIIPNSITSIGSNAFINCDNLEIIEIPNSVAYIGNNAFENCIALSSVTLNRYEPANIGTNLFTGCTSLVNGSIKVPIQSVDIYKSMSVLNLYVDKIGAISQESGQITIAFNSMGGEAIEPIYTNSNSVIQAPTPYRYGYDFVYWYTNSNDVNTEFNFSTPIATNRVFYALWTKDSDINFAYRLENNKAILTEYLGNFTGGVFTLPIAVDGFEVVAFESGFFNNINGITAFSVSNESNYFKVEGGVLYDNTKNVLMAYPNAATGTFIIPNTVKSIHSYAFCNTTLTSLQLGLYVDNIGEYAFKDGKFSNIIFSTYYLKEIKRGIFEGCVNLTEIILPATVKYVSTGSFANCQNLTTISLKNTTMQTKFGSMVFYNCYSLISVYLYNTTVAEIGVDCFTLENEKIVNGQVSYEYEINSNLKIYVPTASVEEFKASEQWSEYSQYVTGYVY